MIMVNGHDWEGLGMVVIVMMLIVTIVMIMTVLLNGVKFLGL